MINIILMGLAYILFAPIIGGLLSGIDRRITARMQGRFGPPILQPFYDVGKLFQKENIVVRRSQNAYIFFFLIFVIFTGVLFYTGEDILLMIFSFTLAGIFLVLAAYKGSSPYSHIGAERELLQMMSYEPMVIMTAIGMYMITHSFFVVDIMAYPENLIKFLPGIFLGFLYILTIKVRKSPFDLSTSHHGHQEIVKGLTVEFAGPALALIEIAHWYELVLILGLVGLFFAKNIVIAIVITLLVYFFEIIIDNVFARVRWQRMLLSSWVISFVLGFGNIVWLYVVNLLK